MNIRKPLAIAVLPAAAVAVLAGCTPTHHHASTAEEKLAQKQAQQIVSACVGKSAGNIKTIETCLAPGGRTAKLKFEACVTAAVPSFTSKGKFEAALDNCVVNDR